MEAANTGTDAVNADTLPSALVRTVYAGTKIVFVTSTERTELHYDELPDRVAAVAGGFARRGVVEGERVLLRIGSTPDDLLALLGLLYLGAVPVSVKPRVPDMDENRYLARVADQQGALRAYGIDHCALERLDLDPRPGATPPSAVPTADDIALVQYTSGSTGLPKPIALSHRAIMGNIAAIRHVDGMEPSATGLITLPLHHDMGLIGALTCVVNGLDLIVQDPRAFLRHPMAALRMAGGAKALHAAFPDFMLRYLTSRLNEAAQRGGADPSLLKPWRTVFCGAEPIRRQTVRAFLEVAAPWGFDPRALVFCYGLAEAALIATAHRYDGEDSSFLGEGPAAPARLGAPIPGLEVSAVDSTGRDCPEGEIGAVWLRGETLFEGYDGKTDHRREWLDTGDLGFLRDGELCLSGRRADRLTVGGANVFVADLEEQALAVPGVAECVALPHGESFTLLVVARRGEILDTSAVAAALAKAFGVAPDAVHEVGRQTIARTASGKPMRTYMVARHERGLLLPAARRARGPITEDSEAAEPTNPGSAQ